jgi:hypothetical protein
MFVIRDATVTVTTGSTDHRWTGGQMGPVDGTPATGGNNEPVAIGPSVEINEVHVTENFQKPYIDSNSSTPKPLVKFYKKNIIFSKKASSDGQI